MTVERALLDTSVFIARETGRTLDVDALPDVSEVCVVTLAELRVGVMAAGRPEVALRRMMTLEEASSRRPLIVDNEVAQHWARLRVQLARAHRRANVNDLWIAAVALSNNLPVLTQDDDFEVLADLGELEVIKV